ncbi:Gfo/Idh/MocA family protein [Paenibacillus radicis (ex Xue et al. 2023)]|uniref:Gfo/Idh/MocA family oxidoreductase n=1 Tax=Paenibacillus radicis (ex Xue et al. 2023) TaxID=2972489 RepID=A0ABT1YQR9_9BACL|nr:Gfo/Idh/MocA family oxidoreductase [Paenibacillus radicis (ex Xue et al. 2023)]MCR8635530.1 Gfo/Idh/MocA family oxidoreductase [Paenibacillus radicis (ex Xue et al. 2023)]
MKKFRIAQIGCGGMSKAWIEYALKREDAEIVALVDIKEEYAAAAAERHGLACGIYTDVSEAILTSGANLVFDVTIPESHAAVATAAMELGCNVLAEKPMATSMSEASRLVELAEKLGRTYAIMQNRRYLPQIRAFRDLVVNGEIGTVGFVNADFFLGPHFGGFRDVMESPLLLDMAIHTFDQARLITGKDPVSVYCHEFNPAGSWYEGNAAAICIFEYADGGVFCYRGSWCAEGSPTSWEAQWRVNGSKGTALWDGATTPFAEIVANPQEKAFADRFRRAEAELTWNGQSGHAGCLDEMFAALVEGRKPETYCTDNLKSMAMVYGALQSAKEGRKIELAALTR